MSKGGLAMAAAVALIIGAVVAMATSTIAGVVTFLVLVGIWVLLARADHSRKLHGQPPLVRWRRWDRDQD